MRSTRIFTPGIYRQNDSVVLTPSGANHVARVLRARAGESIRVFDGADREFRARIVEIKNAKVSVRIEEPVLTVPESPLRIALIQGISRGERMDLVIQKAVELGVTSIHPVIAARSVVKLDKEQSAKKNRALARHRHRRVRAMRARAHSHNCIAACADRWAKRDRARRMHAPRA